MKFENLDKNRINIDQLLDEIVLKATHSSGKGGQNVNKVSTKIVLTFDIDNSKVLKHEIKLRLKEKLKLIKENRIQMTSSRERSQYLNKKLIINKLLTLLNSVLETFVNRNKTTPSKKSVEKRLTNKLKTAKKKELRKIKSIDLL